MTPGRFPLEIIRLVKRSGVIGARLKLLQQLRSEVALVLDDDIELQCDQTVRDILSVLDRRPQVGIVALIFEDRIGDRRKVLSPIREADETGEGYSRVGWFYGGAFAIRREVFKATGPPTVALHYGHEEIELTYLAVNAGYEIVCLHGTRAVHYRLARQGEPDGELKERFRYAVRNRLAVARTYLPFRYRQTHVIFWLLRYLWTAVRRRCLGSFAGGARAGLFDTVDSSRRLNAAAIRYLSRYGGRLWY